MPVRIACECPACHIFLLHSKSGYGQALSVNWIDKVLSVCSWIPITIWIVVRNLTPSLRSVNLGLYGWLGCITLETYVSQFHTWLSTGIPDGQPKMLLTFFPADYPLLNFAGTTAGMYSLPE